MSQAMIGKAEIPSGTLIDNRYIIQQVLGRGGLGRTYLALDTRRFNEPCVLKEFAPSGTGEHSIQKSRDLFKREAKILHQIQHPQIPKFLACFEGDGRLFLVQEYVNGKTYSALLRERQNQGQTFSQPEIIQWLRALLPVLDYTHKEGIVHRDISPDNIMLPYDSSLPVLIDFGVGKQIVELSNDGNGNDAVAQSQYVGKMSLVGKVGYAPREQISLGICSPTSDLYALGVTAVVLLTGKDPAHLMNQHSLEWQWRSYTNVSDAFAEILDKMLADTPRHRYQSVREILVDLERLSEPGVTAVDSLPEFDRYTEVSEASAGPGATEVILPARAAHQASKRQPRLEPQLIDRCEQQLAYYIGPMAELIVEEVLEREAPQTLQELVEALAEEISDLQDAREFKRRLLP